MAKRNRSTLKNYFSPGSLPSHEQFGDLIDSTLNTIDEGFDKSAENGLEVSQIGQHDSLISFCRSHSPKQPVWTIKYDGDHDQLLFHNQQGEDVLALAPGGCVGVNKKDPDHALDVAGAVKAHGRIGAYLEGHVPADGQWHPIAENLRGCQAFEVMAGAGRKNSGKYALLHAIAINTFNPKGWFFNFFNRKKRIRATQAYYRARSDKLKLRWTQMEQGYQLDIRSNSQYGLETLIRYQISRLWFDDYMEQTDSTEPMG